MNQNLIYPILLNSKYFEKMILIFFFYFQHPKRTKPKGLIDLSCAFLYTVHESFFDKRHCFQLVEKALPCLATVTYLSAEDVGELEDWLSGNTFRKMNEA